MILREPRTLGYYAASHWFQWAVLFVVIALLVVVGILPALNDAKERAERQAVELTLRNMRTGMQLAMGEALMHQRENEIATWVGSNPIRWLEKPPVGYRGACPQDGRQNLVGGEWCFTEKRGELIYRPKYAGHLHRFSGGVGGDCDQLRWRVNRAAEGMASGGFVGLRVEAVSPCQWVLPGS